MDNLQWHDTGFQQNTSGRKDRLDEELEYARKSETHLWAAVVTYKISEEVLDKVMDESETVSLDLENMLNLPMIGCLVCEEYYEPKLKKRKCKGDPS